MTTLTDDELTALLARTFSEHESLATTDGLANAVDRSRRGTSRRRRPWLLATAAAVVVVVGGLGWVTGRPDRPAPPSPAASTSAGLTPRANAAELRAATEEAVEAAVQALRMPAGAEELPRGEAKSDPANPLAIYSRSRYWSVPGTVESVSAALVDNPPPGLTGAVDAGPGSRSRSIQYGASGLSGPVRDLTISLTVGATDRSDEVRVLAHASSTPRPARPVSSFVDGAVDSIDVTIVRADTTTPGGRRADLLTVTDPGRIVQIVSTFNGLYATPAGPGGCSGGQREMFVIHEPTRDVRGRVECSQVFVDDLAVGLDDPQSAFRTALTHALDGLDARPTTVPTR